MQQLLCGILPVCTMEAGGMEVSITDHVGASVRDLSLIDRASSEEIEAARALAPVLAERIAERLPSGQVCGFFISFARDPRGHNLPVVVAGLGEKPEDDAGVVIPRLVVHADLDRPVPELPANVVADQLLSAICIGIRARAIAVRATAHFMGDQSYPAQQDPFCHE